MNRKITAVLAIILMTVVISSGYAIAAFIIQPTSEPEASPTPELSSTPTFAPVPTPEASPTAEPAASYDYVVYKWCLKAEYINNETWLSKAYYNYTDDKTWLENYGAYLESMFYSTFPPGRLFPPECYVNLFVDAEFNVETGWTKAVYQYAAEPHYTYWMDGSLNYNHYSIETVLSDIADERDWTKTFS